MDHNKETSEGRAKKIKEREIQNHQNKMFMIEQLRNGKTPKLLAGRTRLKAALFIRSRYEELLNSNGKRTLSEITEYIQNYQGVPSGIRIHRWMLKSKEKAVTPELVKAYQNSSMPQKHTSVYLNLVAALAELAGWNQEDAMIAFVDETGLSDRFSKRNLGDIDLEFDPRVKFAGLLREFVADVAHKSDLANIFGRAEHLQVGWNPNEGPSALFLKDAFQRFTPTSVTSGQWLTDALPPLPSVVLANIPFGHLPDAEFTLKPNIDGNDTDFEFDQNSIRKVTGSATAYWVLHLAIAPQPSGGVQPLLVRTTKLSVSIVGLEDGNALPIEFNVSPHEDAFDELHLDHYCRSSIDWNNNYNIIFDRNTSDTLKELEAKERLYRNPRRKNETDELAPNDDIPVARITRVSPQSIQDWLLDDLDFMDAQTELGPILAPFEGIAEDEPSTWFIGKSLARNMEFAIRDKSLKAEFEKWISTFRTTLIDLEQQHLVKMEGENRRLRAVWKAEDVKK